MICSSCGEARFLREGNCICKPSYFSSEGNCYACHTTCLTCTGSNINQCSSCQTELFMHNGKCMNPCPPGTYANSLTNSCAVCSKECGTCKGPLLRNCTSCASTYFKFSQDVKMTDFTCVEQCPAKFYPEKSSAECRSCTPLCQMCTSRD